MSPPANLLITLIPVSGSYTIKLLDADEEELATATLDAQAKRRYSVVLYGSQSNSTLATKVYTDD